MVAGARSQDDFAPLIGRSSRMGFLNVDHGALARFQNGADGNDKRLGLLFIVERDEAQVLGTRERHAADVAFSRFVFDYFGMHGADPFAGQAFIHDPASLGNLGTDNRPDKHLRLEFAHGIFYVDSNFHRARLSIEHWGNKRDPSLENFTRVCLGFDFYLLAITNPGQVRFVRVQFHPQATEVRNDEQLRPCFDVVAFPYALEDHNPGRGRVDLHVVLRRSPLFDLLDLLFIQSPETQLLTDRFQRPLIALAQKLALLRGRLVNLSLGCQQLFLRRK